MNSQQMIKIGRGKVPDGFRLMDYESFIEFLHLPTRNKGVKVLDKVRQLVPSTLIKTLSGVVDINTFEIVATESDICVIERNEAMFLRFIGSFPPATIDL